MSLRRRKQRRMMMTHSTNLKNWRDIGIRFLIEECGGGGDCMFHCLSKALSRMTGSPLKMREIRAALADTVDTDTRAQRFAKMISEDQCIRTLPGSTRVSPATVTATSLQTLIRKNGPHFQGTDAVLRWLVEEEPFFREENIGFLCFSNHGPGYLVRIPEDRQCEIYITLYNMGDSHWRLVNFRDNRTGSLHSIVDWEFQEGIIECLRQSV